MKSVQIAPNYKAIMKIGSVTIYQEKHFNWFNKLMFKLLFNIEITDYKVNELEREVENE